jgi:hypothetical protein
VPESLEDIGISGSNLSAVDQVEKLQENEDVEHISEHGLLSIACPEVGALLSEGRGSRGGIFSELSISNL